MREIEIDFEEAEFFDVMIAELEREYGRSVARIAKVERIDFDCFNVSFVFSDFRLLEAEVNVKNHSLYSFEPIITIRGEYH
jgi:hypothetical protein